MLQCITTGKTEAAIGKIRKKKRSHLDAVSENNALVITHQDWKATRHQERGLDQGEHNEKTGWSLGISGTPLRD